MRTVFADTDYWVATLNARDQLHEKAKAVSQSLAPVRLVTSEMVLAELLNDLAKRGPSLRGAAVESVARLQEDAATEVVPQTSIQFQEALSYYAQREDKAWGLTDCASFLTMKELGITEALTHDRHFEQAGFKALLRE